ncbi:hypothetical protein BJX76DRAFT_363750 [Aspergillus varians]
MPSAYKDPSHTTIYQITQCLAREGIGCLLWGEHLLRAYACAMPATDYKFILEDDDITPAFTILHSTGYPECTGQYPCPLNSPTDTIAQTPTLQHRSHRHPFPEKHLHIHADPNNPHRTIIGLYLKSHCFPPSPPKVKHPDICAGPAGRVCSIGRFLYAHEHGPEPTPARGGRFPAHLGSVLVPSPMYLIEMLIHLGVRDCRVPGARSIWTRWLMVLREAFVDHGRGLAVWDEKSFLPEAMRPVWRHAIDSEISWAQEPVMNVWRDLAWTLAGVYV